MLEDADTRKALVAQPAQRGGNLLVIEPPGPLANPDDGKTKALPVAPLLLAYAELRYRGTEQALRSGGTASCRRCSTVPRIDPALLPLVSDAVRGLHALGVPFALVGALVPELLLDVPPTRRTNDADLTVVVGSLAEFEDLKARLSDYGFATNEPPLPPAAPGWRPAGPIMPFSENFSRPTATFVWTRLTS